MVQKDTQPTVDIEKIRHKLKKKLDHNRYIHTLGVAYTASALAMCHGADMNKAFLAGLLHDCAKCISDTKQVEKCTRFGINITESESRFPYLLHAKLGAFYAKDKYGVTDEEVLSSIMWHTTGRPAMSQLEMIIFIADYIEPGRVKAKRLKAIRKMAYQDLSECTYMILADTAKYLASKNSDGSMDPTTLEALEYYEKKHNRKKKKEENKA